MADISKIKLPSGNEYDIKDAVARQMISGGVSFNIVWTQTEYASSTAPNAAKLATIPSGVVVYYNNGANSTVGTLAASDETSGKFYLVYSKTQAGTLDAFDEYATVGEETKAWEKIGDTLMDLSGLVTNVELVKSTDVAIGSDATFTFTQPTITLATDTSSATGRVQVATGASGTTKYIGATASGGGAAWNSKDSKTVLTGVEASTTNIKATASGGGASWNSKDSKTVVTGVQASTTGIKATASGGGASWNSKDTKTVVTSVTASTSNLATGSVTGVQAATTTASKAAAAASQVTANGSGTATTNNTDWLKGVSVSSECLTFGAAAMDTQATTQFTFSDVVVPIKDAASTTIATGQLVASGGGASIATNVSIGSSVDVIGSNATLTNTQPTVALSSGASGTGTITVAYDASATGTAAVIGTSATFTNTQPTVALASGATTGTGVVTVAYDAAATGTAAVIGTNATFTNTQPTIALAQNDSTATGRVEVVTDVSASTTYLKASAASGSVTWNNKDAITVLTSSTSISVTKGE